MNLPLPPHLERFVREQLAAGRFHSEADIIRAALETLEKQVEPSTTPASRFKQKASAGSPAAIPTRLPDQLHAVTLPGVSEVAAPPRRSPRGLLADIPSRITPEEIREARAATWAGLYDGEA